MSDPWALPWVLEAASRIDPDTILDFGVGLGQYGFLMRQALDIGRGRLGRDEWIKRIDGIEMFVRYKNPLWDHYYDRVELCDGLEWIENPRNYDLVLLNDVVEHFERAAALELLEGLKAIAPWVILTTPHGRYPQGAVFGNEAETHRSEWTPEELAALGAFTIPIRGTFLAVFGGRRGEREALRLETLPRLFHNTGRSLMALSRQWFPNMVRSRLPGRISGRR